MAKPDRFTRYHLARLVASNRENYQHISYFLEIPCMYTRGDPRVPLGFWPLGQNATGAITSPENPDMTQARITVWSKVLYVRVVI